MPWGSPLLNGFVAMRWLGSRIDRDVLCVHNGWPWIIYFAGSEEQKKRWLPQMARWRRSVVSA